LETEIRAMSYSLGFVGNMTALTSSTVVKSSVISLALVISDYTSAGGVYPVIAVTCA